MQRAQLSTWRKSEILFEPSYELVIRMTCARALTAACKPRHVRAQCGFIERVRVK